MGMFGDWVKVNKKSGRSLQCRVYLKILNCFSIFMSYKKRDEIFDRPLKYKIKAAVNVSKSRSLPSVGSLPFE